MAQKKQCPNKENNPMYAVPDASGIVLGGYAHKLQSLTKWMEHPNDNYANLPSPVPGVI